MGGVVWPMVTEADMRSSRRRRRLLQMTALRELIVCTPYKDLAHCVVRHAGGSTGPETRILRDEDGVVANGGSESALSFLTTSPW